MPSAASILAELAAWKRVAEPWTQDTSRTATLVYRCLYQYLVAAQADLWENVQQGPVLLQYSSDCTPLVSRHYVSKSSNEHSVLRSGKLTTGLLVQHLIMTGMDLHGKFVNRALVRPPVWLQHGKKTRALAACAKSFLEGSFQNTNGSRIQIFHQVYDRGISTQLAHFLSGSASQQSLGSRGASSSANSPAQQDDWQELFLLHSYVGCGCHDAHNALKWGHFAQFNDSKLQESVYVAVSALRTGYLHLVDLLANWLCDVVTPCSLDMVPTEEELQCLWRTLGVEPSLADTLVSFRVLFVDGALRIWQDAMTNRTDWLEDLSACLLGVWRFGPFCSSRWCTIGLCLRGVLASHLLGFGSLFTRLVDSGRLSQYELHGVARLGPSEFVFSVVCGLSSYGPEGFLAALMEDNRMALIADDLLENLDDELMHISTLPSFVWRTLSQLCPGTSCIQLRDRCIAASHVSAAYIMQKSLATALSLPWSLCAGNIADNLEQLKRTDLDTEDQVSSKLQVLARSGYNMDRLADAVALLGQCSFSSYQTEQLHASASVVRKHHPDAGLAHVLTRSFLHSFRSLLPKTTVSDKRAVQLRFRLRRLLNKKPQHWTGRQEFFAQSMLKLRQANALRPRHAKKYDPHKVMSYHGDYWATLDEDTKTRHEGAARIRRSEQIQHLQGQVAHVEAELDLLLERMQQESTKTVPSMQFSSCCLSQADLGQIQGMLSTAKSDQRQSQRLSKPLSLKCPLPVIAEEFDAKISKTLLTGEPDIEERCGTYKSICRARASMTNSIIAVASGLGTVKWFRFLYASLSPLKLVMQRVVSVADADELLHQDDLLSSVSRYVEMTWRVVPMQFETSDVFAGCDMSETMVCMDSFFGAGGLLHSHSYLLPLAQVLEDVGPEHVQEVDPAKRSAKMTDDVGTMSVGHSSGSARPPAGPGSGLSAEGSDCSVDEEGSGSESGAHRSGATEDPEQQYNAIFQQVEASRQEWQAEQHAEDTMFSLNLMAGAWSVERVGRAVYGVRASTKKGTVAYQMADKFRLHKSASFEHSTYTEHHAACLAKVWIHRMAYLTRSWLEAVSPSCMSQQQMAHFEEPPIAEQERPSMNRRALSRLKTILALTVVE